MAASNEESKQALLGAVSRALESYEQGRVDSTQFSALLEQLQVVLEAVAEDAGLDIGGSRDLDGATDVASGGTGADQHGEDDDDYSVRVGDRPPLPGAAAKTCHTWRRGISGQPTLAATPGPWLAKQEWQEGMADLQQENTRLQERVGELGEALVREAQRAAAAEARAEALARERDRDRERDWEPEEPLRGVQGRAAVDAAGQEQRLLTELGQLRAAHNSSKQQLADSRAELAAASRAHAAGASRAETVLMGELEQQRQVAGTLRRDLQRAVATSAREKEALEHEAKRWQLAANQAAAVAERTQYKMLTADQKLEAQVGQVRSMAADLAARGRELSALQQQLTASRTALAARNRYLERLDGAVLQPLLTWHVEADPAVAAALLIAGGGCSVGGAPGGRALPRSRDFVQLKFRAEAVLGAAAAEVDSAVERHVGAAAAAFEALAARITALKHEAECCGMAARAQVVEAEAKLNRQLEEMRAVTALQVRTVQDQLQSTLEAKAQLREALAAEQATAGVRTSELQRLSEREVRLTLQVEQLTADLNRIKHDSSKVLKDQETAADTSQKQRAEAAFERGRQLGDRQAAAAVGALKGELQDTAMQLQATRKECAVLMSQLEEARATAESFDARLAETRQEAHKARMEAEERLRRDADCRLAEAKASTERRAEMESQDHALALQRERERCERAVVDARRAGEMAAEAAQREGELALQRQAGEAELQLRNAMSQAASQLKLMEARHLMEAQDAERRLSGLSEELRLTGEKAAASQDKCEQLIKQVYDATQELQRTRQTLSDRDAAAGVAAHEHAASIAELQSKLLECRQRLSQQAQLLQEYTTRQEDEQAHELDSLRAALSHVSSERDDLQAQCVALTQQLRNAQAVAAGVEVEMETLARALDAHKSARAAAEAAAEEARRSAAAAAEAAEEGAARVAALQQQAAEQHRYHEREVELLEARSRADLDSAQARYQAELEGLQSGLKLLRLKQSRVMAYVDDVFMEEEQQMGQRSLGEQEQDDEGRQRHRQLGGLSAAQSGMGWSEREAGEMDEDTEEQLTGEDLGRGVQLGARGAFGRIMGGGRRYGVG